MEIGKQRWLDGEMEMLKYWTNGDQKRYKVDEQLRLAGRGID